MQKRKKNLPFVRRLLTDIRSECGDEDKELKVQINDSTYEKKSRDVNNMTNVEMTRIDSQVIFAHPYPTAMSHGIFFSSFGPDSIPTSPTDKTTGRGAHT